MEEATKLVEALEKLISRLGPGYTVLALVVAFIGALSWKIYNDWQKEKEVHMALKQMEKTVQRLADQERDWRILFLIEKCNWTHDQVERLIIRGGHEDPASSRKTLEEPRKPSETTLSENEREPMKKEPGKPKRSIEK